MRRPCPPPIAGILACAAMLAVPGPASPLLAETGLDVEPVGEEREQRKERKEGDGRRHERWNGAELFALVSPVPGARLAAGEEVVVAWRGTEALAAERWIEEWEAFLSFDGGHRYPVRITPHMGIDERSVVIRLPGTASANARLLIRFGDERRELEHELPWTFEITAAAAQVSPVRTPAFVKGEEPRGGEQGVVAWAESARGGSAFRHFAAAGRALGIRDLRAGSLWALPWFAPTSKKPSVPLWALFSHPTSAAKEVARRKARAAPRGSSFEPLQQTCRINE